jgi:hypothetical protein
VRLPAELRAQGSRFPGSYASSLLAFAGRLRGPVRAPDFSVLDQSGRTQTLKSIMGPKGAMLVFYRSADW